jgi:hypothetical protein
MARYSGSENLQSRFTKYPEDLADVAGYSMAVTQQFNTTTSMGRLTLNVLLSFAQFEREVTGERIRDKIAASKRKGLWMGGVPPLGYDVRDRSLMVNETEAAIVKLIYGLYLKLCSVRLLKNELDRRGIVSKTRVSMKGSKSGGQPFSRGALYELLANPIYIGEVRHRNERHSGQHEPILERRLWEKTQRILRDGAARGQKTRTKATRSPLAGKLFDENGQPLYVQGAAKGKRRYRYYVSRALVRGPADQSGRGWRIPASEIERAVIGAAKAFLDDRPAVLTALQESGIETAEVMDVLKLAEDLGRRSVSETEGADTLTEITDRVQLTAGGIRVGLKISLPNVGDASSLKILRVTRLVSVKMRRRGVENAFTFQLNEEQFRSLKSQIVTSSWGGLRRVAPYAFTEQKVAMLSSVLSRKRASRDIFCIDCTKHTTRSSS